MKRRGRAAKKKPSAADLLVSPPQVASSTSDRSGESRKTFEFNFDTPVTISAGENSRKSVPNPVNSSPIVRTENISSISELKEMALSRLDSIKRQVDRSHLDIVKEIESSHSVLNKRFKIQTQACQQFMDETEKEFKKMSERNTESFEVMKVSYAEFMAEAQTTGSRVRKTSIPKKGQSSKQKFDSLWSRHGIFSTPS